MKHKGVTRRVRRLGQLKIYYACLCPINSHFNLSAVAEPGGVLDFLKPLFILPFMDDPRPCGLICIIIGLRGIIV